MGSKRWGVGAGSCLGSEDLCLSSPHPVCIVNAAFASRSALCFLHPVLWDGRSSFWINTKTYLFFVFACFLNRAASLSLAWLCRSTIPYPQLQNSRSSENWIKKKKKSCGSTTQPWFNAFGGKPIPALLWGCFYLTRVNICVLHNICTFVMYTIIEFCSRPAGLCQIWQVLYHFSKIWSWNSKTPGL